MFTECPECSTAFRVTAKVLQQAGGRVRCGGCGNAFSAIEHLTEELPGPTEQGSTPPPEADDEPTSHDEFAETSRQLLKTLDELAGSQDVRIEDTGFEWQVLDDEEDEEGIAAKAEIDQLDKDVAAGAAPTEDAPTEDAPTEDEEESGDSLELDDEAQDVTGEQLYDDGIAADADPTETGITDIEEGIAAGAEIDQLDKDVAAGAEIDQHDKDVAADAEIDQLDKDVAAGAEIDQHDKDVAADAAPTEFDEEQVDDPALTEEEDWTGLLEEVAEEGSAADDIPLEVEEELAAIHNELSAKEDPAPVDLDSQFDMQAEAMGIEQGIAAKAEIDQLDKDVAAGAAPTDADEVIELSLEGAGGAVAAQPEYTQADDVPEPSEEEMTINEQIDQELLATAVQDKDFSATIIGLENAEKMFEEGSQEVETIIMEGDAIRGSIEKERERIREEAALKRFDQAGNLVDSYIARRAVRGGRRSTDPAEYSVAAGTILLALLLAGQMVHAYRESLSTYGLFSHTIGPVYRMLGNPVMPRWDITGWQFEATNGSIAKDENVLTILSRIGNKSQQPLPYPLVHVSLTDRREDIIGSRVLEPNEYLAGDLDPSRPVIPGENFTAVIAIDEPSIDATGFRLNVCYRVSPGRVRCANEDFKN